jgi:hypothetical protein
MHTESRATIRMMGAQDERKEGWAQGQQQPQQPPKSQLPYQHQSSSSQTLPMNTPPHRQARVSMGVELAACSTTTSTGAVLSHLVKGGTETERQILKFMTTAIDIHVCW